MEKRGTRLDGETKDHPAHRSLIAASPTGPLAQLGLILLLSCALGLVGKAAREAGATSANKPGLSKFKLVGDPASKPGATWTYESTDAGADYRLNGTLFKPPGRGPRPIIRGGAWACRR